MNIADVFGDLPVLETERTILRKVTLQDAEDLYAYASDEEVSKYTTWHPHRSIEDTRQFICQIMQKYENKEIAPWGIEDKHTGTFIGTCGFGHWNTRHARAEIAYILSRTYWNQGYMTEIVKRMIQFGFEKMGLVRIEARCHPENIASARVMEKAGMQFEGILRKHLFARGVHQDVKMYSIIK